LQARKLGLYAHGMAGFDINKAYEVLGVSKDEYDVLAAVAVGPKGDSSQLSPEAQKMEMPNERKPLAEVYATVPVKRELRDC
jgi:nitroreductase